MSILNAKPITDGVGTKLRRFICGLHGHDALLHFGDGRVSLLCSSCGHETPGWDVKVKPHPKKEDRLRPLKLMSILAIAATLAACDHVHNITAPEANVTVTFVPAPVPAPAPAAPTEPTAPGEHGGNGGDASSETTVPTDDPGPPPTDDPKLPPVDEPPPPPPPPVAPPPCQVTLPPQAHNDCPPGQDGKKKPKK